eukprot:m.978452 g.978452  ORF g.978452 m.978452 type:complete len:504 (-) comp23958_c0_seq1:1880-3391(-)
MSFSKTKLMNGDHVSASAPSNSDVSSHGADRSEVTRNPSNTTTNSTMNRKRKATAADGMAFPPPPEFSPPIDNAGKTLEDSPDISEVSPAPPPIVYVHGFKGSSLVHKETGEINYGSPECFLNMHSPDFSNPMRWDADGRIGRDDLVPGEILQDLKIFGYRYVRIQGPVLEYLSKRAARMGTSFHGYTYDWRREIDECAERFIDFLIRFRKQTKAVNGVQLVAHSMGALLVHLTMETHPELIHSCLYITPAFGTDIGFLEDQSIIGKYSPARQNNNTGFNSTMLKPSLWATIPVGNSFYPIGNRASDGKPPLQRPDGSAIDFDFYNLDDYKKHKLGIYHPYSGCNITPELEKFHRRMLERCGAFRRRVQNMVVTNETIPIRCIISISGTGVAGVIVDTPRDDGTDHVQWRVDHRQPIGDGRVSVVNTMTPPAGITYLEVIGTRKSHFDAPNALDKVSCLLDKLLVDKHKILTDATTHPSTRPNKRVRHHRVSDATTVTLPMAG